MKSITKITFNKPKIFFKSEIPITNKISIHKPSNTMADPYISTKKSKDRIQFNALTYLTTSA